jgi:hypothetical protein
MGFHFHLKWLVPSRISEKEQKEQKMCMEVVMARNGKYTCRNQPDFSVVFGEYFG